MTKKKDPQLEAQEIEEQIRKLIDRLAQISSTPEDFVDRLERMSSKTTKTNDTLPPIRFP